MNLFLSSSCVKKLNKVGPVNFAQALGPHNNHIDNKNYNTKRDRHFETTFWANLDKYFPENLTSNYITITFL